MAKIPDYLLDHPHLPLVVGQSNKSVFPLILTFYGLSLNVDDYKVSQVYRATTGLLNFDLIDLNDNVLTTFVNKASGAEEPVSVSGAVGTVNFGETHSLNWLSRQVLVYDKKQIEIFANYATGYIYDAMKATNDLGYKLSQLLNLVSDNAVWMHSSFAEYSTAGFTLLYQGDASDAPDALDLTVSNAHVVVVNITSGEHQGLLCFYVPT